VYLDTNVFIYILEGTSALQKAVARLHEHVQPEGMFVTSILSLAEVLVAPLRAGDDVLRSRYEAIFDSQNEIETVDITKAILVTAAEVRAATQLSLPDAIHVAPAQRCTCDAIVTNDRRFRRIDSPTVCLITEFS